MSAWGKIAASLAVLSVLACSQAQEAVRPSIQDDLRALADARTALEQALVSDDVPGIIAVLTNDHLTMAPGAPPPPDNRALAEWHQARIDRYAFESSFSTDDVRIYGDLAVERWSGDSRLVHRGEGEDVLDTTKGVWIWERQPSGEWKLMLSIWNSDLPSGTR